MTIPSRMYSAVTCADSTFWVPYGFPCSSEVKCCVWTSKKYVKCYYRFVAFVFVCCIFVYGLYAIAVEYES